jgi:peptide deformylase
MSLLRIYRYGEPILRQKCEPVTEITPEIRQLIRDMFETMYDAPGAGLAAPQVGVGLRICVVDVQSGRGRQPFALINPRIVAAEGKSEEVEGCLSFPGLPQEEVKRSWKVRVEAINEKGFPIVVEGEGLLARAFQHELEHLDGKMFIDHLSYMKKKKMEREIKQRKKRGDW